MASSAFGLLTPSEGIAFRLASPFRLPYPTSMPRKPLKPPHPSKPLKPSNETFCNAIVEGMKLQEAHKLAGFEGKSHAAAWQLRHRTEVAARIDWLLKERVDISTRTYLKRTKKSGDLLARALQKLDDIMSTDVREIVDWRREPVLNDNGEVVDITETVAVKDSAKISARAASAIRGVFTKSGKIRLELHDQRAAAAEIVKLLSGNDAQPASNITVNTINVGAHDALEAAKRVSFLLAAARSREPAVKTIDVTPDKPKE
jgi:hypothetical protein